VTSGQLCHSPSDEGLA